MAVRKATFSSISTYIFKVSLTSARGAKPRLIKQTSIRLVASGEKYIFYIIGNIFTIRLPRREERGGREKEGAIRFGLAWEVCLHCETDLHWPVVWG